MVGGGYFGGRFMRKSEIQDQPAPLVLGIVGLIGYRRASGNAARMVMSGLIGLGCYGAGKMGEEHGVEAGNDGNLFSWSSKGGVNLD
jgi:hypothetical protein